MTLSRPVSDYALGSTDAEHERLIWQAERVAPLTERLFREAGIGPGQRVLDLGSGVGDVAIVSRLVGPSGKVVGIRRDQRSLTRARSRVAEAGLDNVSFIQSDAHGITETQHFDAAVGRFILMWVPDPVFVLCSLSRLVRPGGVVAFQEPNWLPVLALLKPLPLWFAAASLIHETFQESGANPELGYDLYNVLERACPDQPGVKRYRWERTQTRREGSPTLSAVCGREFSSLISPSNHSAVSILFQRDFKPSWKPPNRSLRGPLSRRIRCYLRR